MLLRFFLLFFLCESTVKSQFTSPSSTTFFPTTMATEEKPSPLQLVATPNYPVAAGQRVVLHCSGFPMTQVIVSWDRLVNQTWQVVDSSNSDLTLTEPEQSGLYRCSAGKQLSQNHTVFIISMHVTVGEGLGMLAFALCLLALIINFVIVVWLYWQRRTTTNTPPKGFPAPEKTPKGGLPQTGDGETYMNYTTSQAYSDLDPTSMTEDNVYSSLS